MLSADSYVIITPARNEEASIERTILSVINQTLLPLKWIIVSDASTDRTDEIVNLYATEHSWMQLVRKKSCSGPYFASQITTFNMGYLHLGDIFYDFIGKLDADIQLPVDYYEAIISKFRETPKLGVAGGNIFEYHKNKLYRRHAYKKNVSGGIHLFRRECFQAIGGFSERKEGGYDTIAEAIARMNGWETQTFFDIRVLHLKPSSLASGNIIRRQWQMGRRDYFVGNHPLFELAKCCFRIIDRPYLIGSLLRLVGFFSLYFKGANREISDDIVRFIGKEQLMRLFPLLQLFKDKK